MRSFSDFLHHLFIPKEHNNYRAKALHLHILASYLLFFVALSFIVSQVSSFQNVLGYATDITRERLFALTNQQRQSVGLTPLKYNEKLSIAARKKAEDMFARNYWAHYGPDGTTPWSFILESGYKYEYAGENLAKNFMFSDGVVDAWMESPTHRENILRKEYTEVGFAVVDGMLNGEETTLVVQMFGTPLEGTSLGPSESAPNTDESEKTYEIIVPGQEQVPVAAQQLTDPTVLSKGTTGPSVRWWFFNGNLLFIGFLIIAFLLDMYIAVKLNILHLRIGGKALVHVMFLLFVLAGLVIAAGGKII
ncbi:MAG: CAP domain-containing protein [Patescibacteria group bacterium]|nr:CAP domain-containing protein [Patescibacteria group bacterium]